MSPGRSALRVLSLTASFHTANETVAFSSRAELLVSKLGRSSKPSPRYLILTDKAVYILISQAVQNQVQTTLERKIPLVTIRSVGLSNLRDDWMALNTTSQEDGDPLISCVFKTEFLVHLQQRTNGAVQINIGPTYISSPPVPRQGAAEFAFTPQHPVLEEEGQDGDDLVQEGRVDPARRRLQVVDRQRPFGSAPDEPIRPALPAQAEAEEGGSAEAGQRESSSNSSSSYANSQPSFAASDWSEATDASVSAGHWWLWRCACRPRRYPSRPSRPSGSCSQGRSRIDRSCSAATADSRAGPSASAG